MGEVPDARAFMRPGFPLKFLIDTGHDAQERRFAGAVGAEHADLGAWVEGEPNIVQDDALGRNHLAQRLHDVDKLRSHTTASLALYERARGRQIMR